MQTKKAFKEVTKKWLNILKYIDKYNLYICAVNRVDQLWSYYNT